MTESPVFDPKVLAALVAARMPFGKYKGWRLVKLPEPYLVWFHHQGFPRGKLGEQMRMAYEIKLNGLEGVLEPLIEEEERRGAAKEREG